MKDKSTFAFKMSRAQAQIALAMNQDSNLFLKGEYCFADGTFKRYADFVTLEAYTYVGLLRKIVKLCSMEAESESAENWVSQTLSQCLIQLGGVWTRQAGFGRLS